MANYDVRECDQCGKKDEYNFADERYDEYHHIGWCAISRIVGPEKMVEYDFCSLKCLWEWAREQL